METGAFGKEAYILTGYFNLPKVLGGDAQQRHDPRTRKENRNRDRRCPRTFRSYDQLFAAFREQLHYFVDIKVRGNNVIERLYAEYMPAPFLSLLVDDCIAKGKDYNDGGPRYNTTYIMGVAPATCTDSLARSSITSSTARTVTMDEFLKRCSTNFEGHEKLRLLLWNKTPKFGNDDDYADAILADVFDAFFDEINGRKNTKGGILPRQLSLHHLPRLFRFGHGGNARRTQGVATSFRRHLAGPGRGPERAYGRDQLGRQNGSCSHRGNASESEVHTVTLAGRGAGPAPAPGALVLQNGRTPYPVQCGHGGYVCARHRRTRNSIAI